jgi:dipeptidyl aminopeptidase/acylaminoacyl peptidase
MTIHSRSLPRIAALAAIFVLSACGTAPVAPPAVALLQPPAAMHTENVPPLPRAQIDAAQRYSRVAGHALVDWHPSGREMLIAHRVPGASTTQLFRLRAPLAEPEPLTNGSEPVSNAQWEPREGRYIVFARGSGGDEAYQLFHLDPDTRIATQFTAAGQRHGLAGWIKSRGLAIVASVPLDRTAEGGRRASIETTLTVVDPLKPGSMRVLATLPGGGWGDVKVAPDEKQLVLSQYLSANESEIWWMDLAEGPTQGQRRRLLPAAGDTVKASYDLHGWSTDGRALWLSSDRDGEFMELARLDLAGPNAGTLARRSADTPWDVVSASASADGRLLSYVVNADGRNELRLQDSASGAAVTLRRLPAGNVTVGAFHPQRGEIAFAVSSTNGPSQIHSVDIASATVTAWTRPAGAQGLDLAALPEQQVVRWKSFDGRTISGILTLPPAKFTGRRPVVMLVHGGPESQAKLGWQGRWNHVLTEMGVALFEPNVRGSRGYGKTFLALDNGRLREDSVKDMGTAIDWMATQPRLDAARVVVIGGSYGGYMALAAATRLTERIAGAASTVGISNWVTFLQNTESYRRDLRRVEYGDERDPAMRAFLESISPLNHVDKITKPLLVVQGKNDPRVPWTESEQIVRSLQARGSPVWYLLADNEGHGFARRENADFYFATTLKFIEQTLKP